MNNLFLMRFLVNKYLTGTVHHTTLRIMGYIAGISIAITTFTLSLQIFVAQGFETALAEKMQNIYPDLVITAPENQSFNFDIIEKKFKNQYKEIFACAPGHSKRALLKTDNPFAQSIIDLKALDPIYENRVSNIQKKILESNSLAKILNKNTVIIGKVLASNHNLSVGSTITLLVQDDTCEEQEEEDFIKITVSVGGIIETGVYHYDSSLIICSFGLMQEYLNDTTISTISMKLNKNRDALILLKKITEDHGYKIDCWQTLYPALVAASQLEKYVGTLLLALMALVACSTITAFIFMHIILKKRDIALLKIMGFSNKSISYVFIMLGMILTSSACSIGITTAIICGFFLQKYKLFTLPDVYDVTHIPVTITCNSVLFVIGLILILGFIATLIAVYHIKTINSSQTLRFEE